VHDRRRGYPRPDRPRRRKKRRGSLAVVLPILAAVLVAVVGIVVALVVVLRSGEGWGNAAKASSPADQLINQLVGEWEGEELGGRVGFQFRKDHTATLTTPRDVVPYTWALESAADNVLVIRTTVEGGGTRRTRFVFLSANQVRLESLKVNKSIVLTRKS